MSTFVYVYILRSQVYLKSASGAHLQENGSDEEWRYLSSVDGLQLPKRAARPRPPFRPQMMNL